MTLFDTVSRDAEISKCQRYRYWLRRDWDSSKPTLTWIMLNPSTADASTDDATIRKCMKFARTWGNGGIVVVNLFAYRATDPAELRKADDPIGPENDGVISRLVGLSLIGDTVAAWGVHGAMNGRDRRVMGILRYVKPRCLGVTKDRHPRHPLYVADATPLVDFNLSVERQ